MEYKYVFKELPLEQVEEDADQPRKDFGTDGDENRLLVNIKENGMEEPIKVSEIGEDRYKIIDGHRRFICAKKLGWKSVQCRIYPKMPIGEFEARRYSIQNIRRSWKPSERSEALERIKTHMGFNTNKDLATFLHMTETVVANSLQIKRLKMDYLSMMEKYNISEAYRVEFVRLKPKMRKIKEFEVFDIIKILFEKVQHKIIKSAKDFRTLGRIFLRATANEPELYNFLTNPDMTISELEQRTTQSGFSLHIEQLIQKISSKRKEGTAFSTQEKTFLDQLRVLLNKLL